jgi:serine phosphatase RsbU (regulator of sigma subunit)
MTLQVVEAKSCWLELLQPREDGSGYAVQIAGQRNISREQIEELLPPAERTVRDTVLEQRTALVVDDVAADARFRRLRGSNLAAGSLVVVPLVSHAGLAGILYATKAMPYGFMKDDLDVVSAFADQATIAMENSRLIKRSIERERLLQEMALAQEMQRKLLPEHLPMIGGVELQASSTPAFEVGGDYYDVVELGTSTVGVVVGDVSGKGVPAAFYMSAVKGIFQSLSRLCSSPREFLMRANEVLSRSMDRHSFVSLLYVIVDGATGTLRLARAGHCPLLLVTAHGADYVRPDGIGLGLTDAATFDGATEEQTVQLADGDLCILYTDGVTEARRGEDEFGYERLRDAAHAARDGTALEVRDALLEAIRAFAGDGPSHDDLTIVVMKWRAPQRRGAHDVQPGRGQ